MTNEKDKKLEAAQASLDEILKRIGPYVPKTPQVQSKPEPVWGPVDIDLLPMPQHKASQSF